MLLFFSSKKPLAACIFNSILFFFKFFTCSQVSQEFHGIWSFFCQLLFACCVYHLNIQKHSLHDKWSFPLSVSSLDVTKSAGNFVFGHIFILNQFRWRYPSIFIWVNKSNFYEINTKGECWMKLAKTSTKNL